MSHLWKVGKSSTCQKYKSDKGKGNTWSFPWEKKTPNSSKFTGWRLPSPLPISPWNDPCIANCRTDSSRISEWNRHRHINPSLKLRVFFLSWRKESDIFAFLKNSTWERPPQIMVKNSKSIRIVHKNGSLFSFTAIQSCDCHWEIEDDCRRGAFPAVAMIS